MSNGIRILSVCDHEGLCISRELLLRDSGYEPESVTSREFLKVSYVRTFDIALICSSVETRRVAPLREMLTRYNPNIQVLDLDDLQICFETSQPVSLGPDLLLEAVRKMCEKVVKCTT